jgi:hypothetical protein
LENSKHARANGLVVEVEGYMKAPGRMSPTEVSIQNDPIDAIVAAGEKILIEVAESACHKPETT